MTIPSGTTSSPCNLYFEEGGGIIVLPGGTLEIGQYVHIHGKTAENVIYVGGDVHGALEQPANPIPVNHVTLSSIDDDHPWQGFELCNPSSLNVTFDQCSFSHCGIVGNANTVTITNCTFDQSPLSFTETNFGMHNSSLMNSNVVLEKYNTSTYTAAIDNCQFSNPLASNNSAVIKIIGYPSYSINQCSIMYNNGTGIDLINCGWSGTSLTISNNTIQKSSNPQYGSWGVRAYNTKGILSGNLITNNRYGVSSMHGSSISIQGNSSAASLSQTQRIKDNYSTQIIAFDNSFPYYLHFNEIKNILNPGFYLIYYDNGINPINNPPHDAPVTSFNVKCNCFPVSFNPNSALYPVSMYQYSTWCPGPVPGSCTYVKEGGDSGNYDEAENSLLNYRINDQSEQELMRFVRDFPNTPVAHTAMRWLYHLPGKDITGYNDLKRYYFSLADTTTDEVTKRLSLSLANECNIAMKSYTTANIWFQSQIRSSGSVQDSTYALIDLDLLHKSMKNETAGKDQQDLQDREAFRKKADYLIRRLFEDEGKKKAGESFYGKTGTGYMLRQNYPNPFSKTTTIVYSIPERSAVSIEITDMSGRVIHTFDEGIKGAGDHSLNLDCSSFSGGCYLATLKCGRNKIARIKMTVLK